MWRAFLLFLCCPVQGRGPFIGARYFGGWYNCSLTPNPSCWSHFRGFAPLGAPTDNFFPLYPSRVPLLGLYTTNVSTITAEVAAADTALDYFSMLFYQGDARCGTNADPNLAFCLNAPLAFMLNTSSLWDGTSRLHFFITYSNDIDAGSPGMFVGDAGAAAWAALVRTWVNAMAHPRYLRVNGRPIFEVLIPAVFSNQCGGNTTLANALLAALRDAGVAAGVGAPLIGGGWAFPSVPGAQPPAPRPHPSGYMLYAQTDIPTCTGDCNLMNLTGDVAACEAGCNSTAGCAAFVAWPGGGCALKRAAGPGAPGAGDVYVRVQDPAAFDFSATYNAAPPVCPGEPNWECPRYKNSWWPNATPAGAKVFPYAECADFQAAARGNHSGDPVPYLPNLIAGFDPRPWEEQSPSFAPPTDAEWRAALTQAKDLVAAPGNTVFGFPDGRGGVVPAAMIYAWNEFGEGGILAPSAGAGSSLLQAVADVFAP